MKRIDARVWLSIVAMTGLAALQCSAPDATPGDDPPPVAKDGGGKDAAKTPVDGAASPTDGAAPLTDAAIPPDHVDPPRPDGAPPVDSGSSATKIVAGYFPNWTPSPARIRDVDAHYNLIYLFAAKPVGDAPGTTGAVEWTPPGDGRGAATHLNEDIAYARAVQHRRIVLSIGGAGAGMSFPTRAKSQKLVDSVVVLYNQLGGFDGIDWNTFEGNQAPDTSEMIWMSLELKNRYAGFLISAPPAPWNAIDKTFCAQMVKAGALDYAAPQYYDGPGLATRAYIEGSVDEWVTLLGESHVVVGFGIWDQPNYMAIGDAVATWKSVKAKHAGLRGAFDWQIHIDEGQGWPFAKQVGPLVVP